LRSLARREHGRAELERKLTARGHPRAVVVSVLDELGEEGLLAETRFVSHYVGVRARRGYGPSRIKAELLDRGVAAADIDAALAAEDNDWGASARAERVKRFGAALPSGWPDKAKQMRFLEARGFSHAHIRHALGATTEDESE
jgi:regulatory protein